MYTVMLIDDEANLHTAIGELLVSNGYEYCGAMNGEEGLEALTDEKPDLLLLDVMLPGINGFDLCRKIREKIEENPSEPKYLLTVQRVGYKMADAL